MSLSALNASMSMARRRITARVAASSHVVHAIVMGTIQAVVTLSAMFSIRSEEPMWFWLTGIAMMIPAAWLGGWLRQKKS